MRGNSVTGEFTMFSRCHCFSDAGRGFIDSGRGIQNPRLASPCRIGLALGGGFARGIAHAGVLKVLEERNIPIHCVAGVSAGSLAAAAFASGVSASEIARISSGMRFRDVARWTFSRMGLVRSERMEVFLK